MIIGVVLLILSVFVPFYSGTLELVVPVVGILMIVIGFGKYMQSSRDKNN